MKAIGTIIIGLLFFTANFALSQDSLYIYKAGAVIYKQVVSNIDSVTFKKSTPVAGTVSDIDGNIYHTVTIGTQVWMVENFKATKYRNGDAIPNVADSRSWVNLKSGAQCNYNNDEVLGNKYGKLYNWYAVNDSRKLAPAGWHIPSNDEWTALDNYVESNFGTSGNVGKALAAKTDWVSSSYEGVIGNDLLKNNASGFTALPGGVRTNDFAKTNSSFIFVGENGYWWSSTEYQSYWAWDRFLYNFSKDIDSYFYNDKINGQSVRCIKD